MIELWNREGGVRVLRQVAEVSDLAGGQAGVTSGTVIGDTLVLQTPTGTVNVPLIGDGSDIDFLRLNTIQKNALRDAIKGTEVCNLSGSTLGFLV